MAFARAQFPSGPLIDPATGELQPAWRGFLLALYERTGGTQGVASSDGTANSAALQQEIASRVQGDTTLNTAITNEVNTRTAVGLGLQQEIAALTAHTERVQTVVVGQVQAQASAGAAETAARIAADATLVPIAGLAARIVALAFDLPTSDPGGRRLWRSGTVVNVGSDAATLGLQDGTGSWALEDGTGVWEWGGLGVVSALGLEDGTGRWITEDGWGAWSYG